MCYCHSIFRHRFFNEIIKAVERNTNAQFNQRIEKSQGSLMASYSTLLQMQIIYKSFPKDHLNKSMQKYERYINN